MFVSHMSNRVVHKQKGSRAQTIQHLLLVDDVSLADCIVTLLIEWVILNMPHRMAPWMNLFF